jgi:pyruvate-formate lyase-activating enzyme
MPFKPSVILFLTERCNLKCPFCCVEGRRSTSSIAPETFRRVVRDYRPLLLQLTGGEPTIHPRFDELLGWALRRVPAVQFTTNGAGGPEHFSRLMRRNGKKPLVVISLDAPDERHDAIRRRKGLFREILDATAALREARIPVSWNCTVFPPGTAAGLPDGNISAVPELIALSRRMRVPFNAQPACGAPPETRRALGAALAATDSPFITNSPRFIRMLQIGDSGPCRYNKLNVSIDTGGNPMPTSPGDCYFAESCERCYYTCVWEPTFLLSGNVFETIQYIFHIHSTLQPNPFPAFS